MNNFIFENTAKVFFGRGCVKEYLDCLTKSHDMEERKTTWAGSLGL